ncbi:hypothetical protein ABZP36_034610 [Zizania latifolia]
MRLQCGRPSSARGCSPEVQQIPGPSREEVEEADAWQRGGSGDGRRRSAFDVRLTARKKAGGDAIEAGAEAAVLEDAGARTRAGEGRRTAVARRRRRRPEGAGKRPTRGRLRCPVAWEKSKPSGASGLRSVRRGRRWATTTRRCASSGDDAPSACPREIGRLENAPGRRRGAGRTLDSDAGRPRLADAQIWESWPTQICSTTMRFVDENTTPKG